MTNTKDNTQTFITSAREVLDIEAKAISTLASKLDVRFTQACELILQCKGRVIVTGIGKSGHIGNKIAATFASTGTPAFFVHPSEASHGDLGMITANDIVIAISNSGETPELLTILPIIKRMNIGLISMTGKAESSIAHQADVNLDINIEREACPLGLAPTASTTASLALGDALAVALLKARNFNEQDFARSHPGGALGKRLLLYVEDLMHSGKDVPLVQESDTIETALKEMSAKGLGMAGVINEEQHLVGVFTDGDLRRALGKTDKINSQLVSAHMTPSPFCVSPSTLALELVNELQSRSINGVFIVDEKSKKVLGAINMHDLLRAGII